MKLERKGMQKGLQKGLQQGLQQGLQKGLQQGEYRKAVETTKSMYSKRFPLEIIAEITKLSLEEINRLIKEESNV